MVKTSGFDTNRGVRSETGNCDPRAGREEATEMSPRRPRY